MNSRVVEVVSDALSAFAQGYFDQVELNKSWRYKKGVQDAE